MRKVSSKKRVSKMRVAARVSEHGHGYRVLAPAVHRRFSASVRFKVFKSTGEVAVNVVAKNQEVGFLLLWPIGSHSLGRCQEAVDALLAEIFGGQAVPIWRVGDAQLDPEYRNQGLGLKMYERALKAIGPAILVQGGCTGMGTTPEAQRVWQSLAQRYPTRGSSQTLALAVV
jgi:GNAT superfamily N-acetyltransferase